MIYLDYYNIAMDLLSINTFLSNKTQEIKEPFEDAFDNVSFKRIIELKHDIDYCVHKILSVQDNLTNTLIRNLPEDHND